MKQVTRCMQLYKTVDLHVLFIRLEHVNNSLKFFSK
jgi:hypothetical protein